MRNQGVGVSVQSATRQCGIQTTEWTPAVAPSKISNYYEYYKKSIQPGKLASNVELENDIASMDEEYIEAVRRYRAEKSKARRENLLALTNLSVQNNLLPATEETMTVIDRTLKRKKFKESIPQPILNKPPTEFTPEEKEQEKIRARMLVQYDIEEWQHRENNLAENQNAILKQLSDLLILREKSRAAMREEIVNRTRQSCINSSENLKNKLEVSCSRQIFSSTNTLSTKSISDKNRFDEIMKLRSGREVMMKGSKGVTASIRHPVLTVPHTDFSKESVYSTVHGANILNAPIIGNNLGNTIKKGKTTTITNMSKFSGVIKLAGTDLKKLIDLQTIINAIPRRLKDVSLATDVPLKYRLNVEQEKKIIQKNSNSSRNSLPTILPPPNMTAREYKQHLQSFKLTKFNEYESKVNNDSKKSNLSREMLSINPQNIITEKPKIQQIQPDGNDTYYTFLTQIQVFNQSPPPNDIYQKQDAVIFLLNVIRGIVTHNRLMASLEARRGLLDELILAQELKDYCDSQNDDNSNKLLTVVKNHIIATQIASSISSTITDAVNAIAIENVRNEQLVKVKAVLKLASQERARRENSEIVTRQIDIADRLRFNVRRREIQDAHSRIASLLIDKMASTLIKKEASKKGAIAAIETVNKIAERDASESATLMKKPMEAMKNLLQEFLLPEVDRKLLLQKIKKEEEKNTLAVEELKEVLKKIN